MPANAKVYHFHPTGLAGLLSARLHPIIKIHGKDVELAFLSIFRGDVLADDEIKKAASDLNCEPGLIYAIARQESAHSSFITIDEEKVPAILFEKHWFARLANDPQYRQSYPEIYGPAYKRARIVNGVYKDIRTNADLEAIDVYEPGGRHQYERLIAAYQLNENAALQSCSWGKFQIMGFNYKSAGFKSVKEFTQAMSIGDAEHMKAFLKFAKSNSTLLSGLRQKNFEKIAEGHNGSGWKTINPEYATNLESFYNEYKNTHPQKGYSIPLYRRFFLAISTNIRASETLCTKGERNIISFTTNKSMKIASLCEGAGSGYLIYRFGKSGLLELEYPAKPNKES